MKKILLFLIGLFFLYAPLQAQPPMFAPGPGSETVSGIVELATDAETATGTSDAVVCTPGNVASVYQYDTIWIGAAAMAPTTTNGATFGSCEYATNDLQRDYYAFDTSTEQYVDFDFPMPEAWDRGTIKAKFYWSSATGSSINDTVEWELRGGAFSDSDALDAALGTAQVISDVVLADNGTDLQISAATPAITIGGTPALGCLVHYKASRNVSGTDNMLEKARLFGILIQYKKSNTVSAW